MTKGEASEKYNIPIEVLKEYESWGLCGEVKKVMGAWQYDDQDLERLGMIMTLHDIGFGTEKKILKRKIWISRHIKILSLSKRGRLSVICFLYRAMSIRCIKTPQKVL